MTKTKLILSLIIIFGCSKDTITNSQNTSNNIAFVLCEGAFNNNDGSLWGIKDNVIQEIGGNPTGNTATSVATHGNNLYVINNASGNILKYTISEEGIVEQSTEMIDLSGTQPREVYIIGNNAYVSQWAGDGIAVIDLSSFSQTGTIEVEGSTEGLAYDGTFLYASSPYSDISTYTSGNSVVKIDIASNSVIETYEVFTSPQKIIFDKGLIFVSHTYYDASWESAYASSVIDISTSIVTSVDHGNSVFYGNDFAENNGTLYRSYDKGIISFNDDLTLIESTYIGTSNTNSLYSMDINNGIIYLGFTDNLSPDDIAILDFNGNELGNYQVGALPGSFAFWTSE